MTDKTWAGKLKILVIGGMNMDILGQAGHAFQAGDSLPGTVTQRPGGVARNIAACLAHHGAGVELVCPLSGDEFGNSLRQACAGEGIGLNYAVGADFPTSVYLAIHELSGDMVCAVNDMRAMEALTPEKLRTQIKRLSGFDAAVLDANLREDSLLAAANQLTFPLIADPVSAVKSHRLLPILGRLHAIKPNRLEAKVLTGEDDYRKAADILIQRGVRQVYISLGIEGLYYSDGTSTGCLPALPAPPVSLTGAGDAMTAGLAMGIACGMAIEETARHGLCTAADFLRQSKEKN